MLSLSGVGIWGMVASEHVSGVFLLLLPFGKVYGDRVVGLVWVCLWRFGRVRHETFWSWALGYIGSVFMPS